MLLRPLLRQLKRKSHDSLDSVFREYRYFSCGLPGLADVRDATVAGILALTILTHDDPV